MIRFRLFYFVEVATALSGLNTLRPGVKLGDCHYTLFQAETQIAGLLTQNVLPLRSSRTFAQQLHLLLSAQTKTEDKSQEISLGDLSGIWYALAQFNAAFNAETSVADTYVVSPKSALIISDLIQNGEQCFQPDLTLKVPESVTDARECGKCIAFELPTAAAFHLHRLTESVVRKYFDAVSGGADRPKTRNLGDYLREMDRLGVGAPRVKAALRDLKDLHRNPIVHPEDSVSSVHEAIALLGAVNAVLVHMLAEIPDPRLADAGLVPMLPTLPPV